MRATTKELRYKTNDILKAVERGEEVVITYRGKPKAKIVPLKDAKSRTQKMQNHPAFGMWKDNEKVKDVHKFVRTMRKGRFR